MKTGHLKSLDDLDTLLLVARECVEDGECEYVIKKVTKRRSVSQNASLHLWCTMMAQKLTDSGLTQRKLWDRLKPGFDLPVSAEIVKDVFRSVGQSMFKKDSTADLSTVEMQEVYRAVDQGFAETTGCQVEWPSDEPPAY